jgi:hypothetical protein
LEISLTIQSGWNLGGPTVVPEEATKKFAWTETVVEGPSHFAESLLCAQGRTYRDGSRRSY